jgi:GH15 family glucan-1,4-alpha-glucosidase
VGDQLKHGREDSAIQRSIESILRNQKANGAIIASPDFDQYHYCWLRDGSFCAYALDWAGENEASAQYHSWANNVIHGIGGLIDSVIDKFERGVALDPTHMPPARFSLGGTSVGDDWPNFQVDGYGTWLWSLGEHLRATGQSELPEQYRESVVRVGSYLATFGLRPCYDVWEESGNAVHTSTLACVYGGLAAAARLLDDDRLLTAARKIQTRLLEGAAQAGYFVKSNQNADVDASALWLSSPFHVVSPSDPTFIKTVDLITGRLTLEGGLRRYSTDTYFGSGAWPVLTASLGWHYVVLGDLEKAHQCKDWISARIDKLGRLGEQFGGEVRDPKFYHEWVERWGPPAQDLNWSHAMYVVLSIALANAEETSEEGSHVLSLKAQAPVGVDLHVDQSVRVT